LETGAFAEFDKMYLYENLCSCLNALEFTTLEHSVWNFDAKCIKYDHQIGVIDVQKPVVFARQFIDLPFIERFLNTLRRQPCRPTDLLFYHRWGYTRLHDSILDNTHNNQRNRAYQQMGLDVLPDPDEGGARVQGSFHYAELLFDP